MKKRYVLLFVALLAMLVVGCEVTPGVAPAPVPADTLEGMTEAEVEVVPTIVLVQLPLESFPDDALWSLTVEIVDSTEGTVWDEARGQRRSGDFAISVFGWEKGYILYPWDGNTRIGAVKQVEVDFGLVPSIREEDKTYITEALSRIAGTNDMGIQDLVWKVTNATYTDEGLSMNLVFFSLEGRKPAN